jgi:hypothetical protein
MSTFVFVNRLQSKDGQRDSSSGCSENSQSECTLCPLPARAVRLFTRAAIAPGNATTGITTFLLPGDQGWTGGNQEGCTS